MNQPTTEEVVTGLLESDITAAVVIPFRDRGRDPLRQKNLDKVRARWELGPWPVIVADDGREGDAQFNRSAAYNRGAKLTEAQVIIYAESDMLIADTQVLTAVYMAASTPGLVVPFMEYRYLSERDSERVRAGAEPTSFRPESITNNGASIGAINVVSRRTLDLVGGYTERTEGSWYDDTIMRHAFDRCAGQTRWVKGPAHHLYHLPGWKGSHRTVEDRTATAHNRELWHKVRHLTDPTEIRHAIHGDAR